MYVHAKFNIHNKNCSLQKTYNKTKITMYKNKMQAIWDKWMGL